MSREVPASRYDLSTYRGRVLHTIQITDPRTLFTTSADLARARQTLDRYRSDKTIALTEETWHAKKILDSTVHPETGKPIFLPFRMSCFVLTNLVVTAGMLTPNLSTRGTVFWQVTNQSINVAFNYANANKSSPLTTGQIVQSYALAVAASCGVALGLRRVVGRIRAPNVRDVAGRLVPFVAVAGAGALNVLLMRSGELVTGIDVFAATAGQTTDGDGDGAGKDGQRQSSSSSSSSLGKSKRAAWTAIGETAASRVLNSSPIMVIPPLILLAVQRKTSLLQKYPRLGLPLNLLSIFVTSIVALPLAIAAFPTTESLPLSKLEEDIRQKAKAKNVKQVVFNRGM